jgi:HEAT repeat protein
MLRRACWLLLLIAAAPSASSAASPTAADDEKLLKAAGVDVDGPGLLKYLSEQTFSGVEQVRAAVLIARLGRDSFAERQKASARLKELGARVRPLLRRSLGHPDEEIKDRLRDLLAEGGDDAGPARRLAAVRLLRDRPTPGAAAALLDFLPGADDEVLEDEALYTLAVVGVKDGKVDAALADAVHDPQAQRRAAAALALGRSGTAEQRTAARGLLTDPEPAVRFRAAQGLLAARDRAALPALIALLGEAPHQAGRAEDLLFAAAGMKPPRYGADEDPAARKIAKTAWSAWWKTNGKIDLARAEVDLPPFNQTLRAREAARRFANALLTSDGEAARKVAAVPFLWIQQALPGGQDIEDIISGGGFGVRGPADTFAPLLPIAIDEYLRTASPEERNFLAGIKNEVRVLQFTMVLGPNRPPGNADLSLLIRVVNGQPRVIGVGPGNRARIIER